MCNTGYISIVDCTLFHALPKLSHTFYWMTLKEIPQLFEKRKKVIATLFSCFNASVIIWNYGAEYVQHEHEMHVALCLERSACNLFAIKGPEFQLIRRKISFLINWNEMWMLNWNYELNTLMKNWRNCNYQASMKTLPYHETTAHHLINAWKSAFTYNNVHLKQ